MTHGTTSFPGLGLCRLAAPGRPAFPALLRDGRAWDIRPLNDPRLADIGAMLRAFGAGLGKALAAIEPGLPLLAEVDALLAGDGPLRLAAPVDDQEVWGAGMTYALSPEALDGCRRERPLYAKALEAARPLLFYKSSPGNVRGHLEPLAPRRDATRTIPEAELTLLVAPDGAVTAYALGNDVTAVDLEMDNPLYQPQAKVFLGGCSVGPFWSFPDPGAFAAMDVRWTVERAGEVLASVAYPLANLLRPLPSLGADLAAGGHLRGGAALLIGAGAPCPAHVSLEPEDVVRLDAPGLPSLTNPVHRL